MSTQRPHIRMEAVTEAARVTPLELFFDLVFVFGLTQITAFMAADLSATAVLRGLLVFSMLWWCWVGFAWLGNVVRADEGIGRVAMFGAMAAMFVLALSIPESFTDLPGGLSGPVVFALGYLAVRVLHLTIFWLAAVDDPGLRLQLLRFAPSVATATVLLLVASQLSGTAQMLTWVAALVADYVGTVLAGASGWRVRSSSHFAERHGLILIVALGESVVAIGVGVSGLAISWPIVVAAILGLTVAAAIWWAYFDVVALVAERVLHGLEGEQQARLARDSYSFLHLPMLAGVLLLALGLKKVLEYAGDTAAHDLSDALGPIPAGALYGGAALYLLALVAFRYRNVRSVNAQRAAVGLGLLALAPVATQIPALAALAVLAAITSGLIAFEAVHFAEIRTRVRHEGEAAVSVFARSEAE